MTQISSDLTYGIIFVCQLKVNISYFLIFLPDDKAEFLCSIPTSTFLTLALCSLLFVKFPPLLLVLILVLVPHVLVETHRAKWRSKNYCYGLPHSCLEFSVPVI